MNPGEYERQKNANAFKVKILKAKSTIRKGKDYYKFYKVFTNCKYDNLMMIKNKSNEKKKANSSIKKAKNTLVDNDKKNYQHQHLFKNLLKEFGIGQYLRVYF